MTTRKLDFALRTLRRIDLYVAPATGSDANPGTAAQPLATLDEAIRRLNYYAEISADPLGSGIGAMIHLASGAYTWTEVLGPFLMNEPIVIDADGAGQPGDDGFTELLGSTAAVAGSSAVQVVTGGGLGVDTYAGKTIEVLTGASAGDRRLIGSHSDTTIIPVRQFSAAIAINDTFRIVEPAANITLGDLRVLGVGLGGSEPTVPRTLVGFPSSRPVYPGLGLVNLQWLHSGTATLFYAQFVDSRVYMYGCETPVTLLNFKGNIFCGSDTDNMWFSALGPLIGAPAITSWAGWGFNGATPGVALQGGVLEGYFTTTGGRALISNEGSFYMVGGRLTHSHASQAALQVAGGSGQRVTVGNFSTFVGITPRITNTLAGPAVQGDVGTTGNGDFYINLVRATLSSAGRCLQMRGSGVAVVASSAFVAGAGAIGIDSSTGAKTYVGGACGILGAAGADLTVDAGATTSPVAALGAAGAAVLNGLNGSAIVRQN